MKKSIIALFSLAMIFASVLGFVACSNNNQVELPNETYTVFYDANGGSFLDGKTIIEQTDIKGNSLLTAPDSPEKTGYMFSGWAIDKEGTKFQNFVTDKISADMTLYAVWEQEQAAILSVDGASINDMKIFMLVSPDTDSVSLSNKVICSSNSTWRLYYDKLGQIEIPTKIAASIDGALNNGNNVFYIVVTSFDNTQVNVYEFIIHRSYSVSIQYMNGKNVIATDSCYTGNEFKASYIPTIEGYTFNYWNTFEGEIYTSAIIWEPLSLYANTSANTYTITLDVNEGDPLSNTEQVVTFDSSYSLIVPSRTGYSFIGWFIGNTQVTNEQGQCFNKWTIANNCVAVAHWNINQYTVSLESNNAAAGAVSGEGRYNYGEQATISASTNKGYNFLGWYNENDELLSSENQYSFTIGASNVTYTAKWDYYTVTSVNSNTHAGNITKFDNEKISIGEEITLTATTNLGYTWLGWYNDNILLTKNSTYSFTMGRENVTYTARWQIADEMLNFIFSSTENICEISGVKNTVVTNIIIPDYVTSISSGALANCDSLKSITLPFIGASRDDEENTYIGYIFGAISHSVSNQVLPKSLKEIIITDCERIDEYAFFLCTGLTNIILPQNLKNIDNYAFYGCTSLIDIVIPDNVETIGMATFYNCSSIESITLPFLGSSRDTLDRLGYLFRGQAPDHESIPSSLKEVILTEGTTILDSAFYNCSGLQYVSLPNSILSIGSSSFFGCSSLTELIIPNSVNKIGNSAFSGCSSLINITIPNGVECIEHSTFSNCSSLKDVTLGNGLTSIGDSAFSNCSSLTEIIISDYITTIGDSAFSGCSNLKNVTLSNGLTSIGVSVFSNCSSLTEIVIPDHVTTIGDSAFSGCSNLKNVTLSNGLTSIGDSAFSNCSSLTEIIIPDHITTIGDSAFSNCSNLKNVTLSNGLTSIGDSAFSNCNSLIGIVIPDNVSAIGYSAFGGCSSLECITVPFIGDSKLENNNTHFGYIFGASNFSENDNFVPKSLKEVFITNGTIIDNFAFKSCSSLSTIEISDSISTIGSSAFFDCVALTNVIIGDGVKRIEDLAFSNCCQLTNIIIPDNIEEIGKSVFNNCTSLESITLPFIGASKDGTSYTHFGYIFGANSYLENSNFVPKSLKVVIITSGTFINGYSFYQCNTLTEIIIPNEVTVIGYFAFFECSALTHISIPNSVNHINGYAFSNCSSIRKITLSNNVKSIGDAAFSKCTKLTYITIPNSVTSIGKSAFSDCEALESITIPFVGASKEGITNTHFGYIFGADYSSDNGDCIPKSLTEVRITGGTTIASDAFRNCNSLISITFSNSIENINDYAFYGCNGLTNIVIPNSVQNLGNSAFCRCNGLKSIIIGDGVKKIGDSAFAECENLATVTIGNSVITIGDSAFRYCSEMTSLTMGNSVTNIEKEAFYGCSKLISITIPENVELIGESAFAACNKLTNIIMPKSIISIKASAFYSSALKNIYYKGTPAQWDNILIENNENSNLISAIRYYYSEIQPTDDGNYWRYVDGVPTIWTKETT